VTAGNPEIFAGRTFTVPPQRRAHVVDVVLRHIDATRPLRILDLGCGTGLNTVALADALPRATVTGLDVSTASITAAESARRTHPAADRITLATADYMAFTGGPFDVIVSDTVLHAIPAPTDVLFDKLARDLTPGGLLVYTMPTDAASNRTLTVLRRLFRLLRSRATDALLLALARVLHGRDYDDALLRERVPYMYLVPHRYDSEALHDLLRRRWNFDILATEPIARASIAQLAHRLVVARRAQ
jgi:trans-aconitate methyltransferase